MKQISESQYETDYMFFTMIEDTGKTQKWKIIALSDGFTLGYIKWFGRWRQYTFFPEKETVFNRTCLDEITSFLKLLMEARK